MRRTFLAYLLARSFLAACAPRRVREKSERQAGRWAFGRPRILYVSDWACG